MNSISVSSTGARESSEGLTKGIPRSITTSRNAHICSGVLTGQKRVPNEIYMARLSD